MATSFIVPDLDRLPPAGSILTPYTPLVSCTRVPNDTRKVLNIACYPPGMGQYLLNNERGYFSPALCPSGWVSAVIGTGERYYPPITAAPLFPGESGAVCCPSAASKFVSDSWYFCTKDTPGDTYIEVAIHIRWRATDLGPGPGIGLMTDPANPEKTFYRPEDEMSPPRERIPPWTTNTALPTASVDLPPWWRTVTATTTSAATTLQTIVPGGGSRTGDPKGSQLPRNAVIGIIVGISVFLITLLVGFLLWRRWKMRKRLEEDTDESIVGDTEQDEGQCIVEVYQRVSDWSGATGYRPEEHVSPRSPQFNLPVEPIRTSDVVAPNSFPVREEGVYTTESARGIPSALRGAVRLNSLGATSDSESVYIFYESESPNRRQSPEMSRWPIRPSSSINVIDPDFQLQTVSPVSLDCTPQTWPACIVETASPGRPESLLVELGEPSLLDSETPPSTRSSTRIFSSISFDCALIASQSSKMEPPKRPQRPNSLFLSSERLDANITGVRACSSTWKGNQDFADSPFSIQLPTEPTIISPPLQPSRLSLVDRTESTPLLRSSETDPEVLDLLASIRLRGSYLKGLVELEGSGSMSLEGTRRNCTDSEGVEGGTGIGD